MRIERSKFRGIRNPVTTAVLCLLVGMVCVELSSHALAQSGGRYCLTARLQFPGCSHPAEELPGLPFQRRQDGRAGDGELRRADEGRRAWAAIVPGKADQSRMILMLEGKIQPRMPFRRRPAAGRGHRHPQSVDECRCARGRRSARRQLRRRWQRSRPWRPDIKPQVAVVSPVASVRFSPDGKLLAVGGYQEVRLIDPATGKPLATLSGHADYVRSLAFSPDGKMLAAAGGPPQRGGEIKIWDVRISPASQDLGGHKDCIYSVAWSPDGKLLASGSYDKMVKLWDVATGQEVKNLQDHIDAVFAVAFSPDGKHLASASQDRQ